MGNGTELQPVICVLNPDDVYQIKNFGGESKYKPCIVTPYDVQRLKDKGISFPSNIIEGTFLSLSPDQKSYYEQTSEQDIDIVRNRMLAIEYIVSYLGGKEFRLTASSEEEWSKIVGVNVEIGASVEKGVEAPNEAQKNPGSKDNVGNKIIIGGKAGANVNKDQHSKSEQKSLSHAEWGGNFTAEGYNRAKEIAKENGIIDFEVIKYLLEMRNPMHPNPIKEQLYLVDLRSDLEKNIKVAGEIRSCAIFKSIQAGAHISCDVKNESKSSSHTKFGFYATFGPIKHDTPEERMASTKGQPIFNSNATDLDSFKESEMAARQQLAEEIDEKISETRRSLKDLHSSLDSTTAALDSFKESEVAARQQLKEDVSAKLDNQQQSLLDLHLALDGTSADLESFKESEVAARQQLAEDVDEKFSHTQQSLKDLHSSLDGTSAALDSFKETEVAARQQLKEDVSTKLDNQQQSLQDLRLALDGTSADLESFKESEVAARQQLAEEIDEKISDTQQSLKDLNSSLDSTTAALDSFKETEVAARQQLKEDVSTKLDNQQQSLHDLRLALDGTSADLESFKESEVAARQQLAEEVNAKYEEHQQLITSLQEQLQRVDCSLKQLSDEINTYQELMAKQYVRNKKLAIVISSAIGSLSIIGILLSFLL